MTTSNTKYAVDLSDEGVSLWRRDLKKPWQLQGKVALSSPSFSDELEELKNGQTPNNGSKFAVQVRIPRSEIFVSSIDLGGVKGAAATSKIKKFLGNKTPYLAKDLIYNLEADKATGRTFVAAITKKTISEAREFISGYGFEALYYTTKIDKAEFPKSPRFYDEDHPVALVAPPVEKSSKPTETPASVVDQPSEPVEKPATDDTPKPVEPKTTKPVELDTPPPPPVVPVAPTKTPKETVSKDTASSETPKPKDAKKPAKAKPAKDKAALAAPSKADLSGFETVRSKSLVAPNKRGGKIEPTIAKAPPSPPRRISIDVPKVEAGHVSKPEPVSTPASKSPKALKMPQGDPLQTEGGGFFKPRYIIVLLAIILAVLFYWFYTALFDGKEEIARLQQTPALEASSEPTIVAQPQMLEQSASTDASPILKQVAEAQAIQTPTLATPLPEVEPEPGIAIEETVKSTANQTPGTAPAPTDADDTVVASTEPEQPLVQDQTTEAIKPDQETATTETASLQPSPSTVDPTPQPDAKPAETETAEAPLVPTKEGTPGAEGITLFAGQPDIVPPRRDQLKVSTDPLKNVPPKMRSAAFENTHKGKAASEPEPVVATEAVAEPDTSETEVAAQTGEPDLLALADQSLKSSLPKLRPSSISKQAGDAKISLLTKADPSLANIKPKRRPSNLSIPVVTKLPEKIDPSEIAVAVQQAVLDVARPKARPRDLKRIVARTKAAEKTNQQNVQTASLTPATAVNTSKPSAPTAVNVQKEATERSGFSKRRMSLIGVYGSSSNRRALVRLPSGRYVKVKPGQKLSGWKVSAIGESSIRITKGNRNEVLRLPK